MTNVSSSCHAPAQGWRPALLRGQTAFQIYPGVLFLHDPISIALDRLRSRNV